MSSSPASTGDATARHAAALDELVSLGIQLARAVQAEALATPTPDRVAAFDRVARTVRRTILLARTLAEPPAPGRLARRTEARARIIRDVEDAIGRHRGPERPETLHAELAERLDDPDLDEELDARPVADIILDIRRDLGLEHAPGTHPWCRRTPADIRRLRRHAAAPTAPPLAAPPGRTSAPPDHPGLARPPPNRSANALTSPVTCSG